MDVNAYTLQLIDNYIEATGQGVFRRASLSASEYLMFRKQAEEECRYVFPVTNTVPVAAPVQRILEPAVKQETPTPKPVPAPHSQPSVPSYTEYEDLYEEEEEDDMEALLRSTPG